MSEGLVSIRGCDLWMMVLSTLRYSMGRQSYITQWCDEMVRRYRGHLTTSQLEQVLRELREELTRATRMGKTLGHRMDHERWESLARYLEEGLHPTEMKPLQTWKAPFDPDLIKLTRGPRPLHFEIQVSEGPYAPMRCNGWLAAERWDDQETWIYILGPLPEGRTPSAVVVPWPERTIAIEHVKGSPMATWYVLSTGDVPRKWFIPLRA